MPGRAEPLRGEDAQHRLPGHRGARVPLHRLQVTPRVSVSVHSPSVVCRVRHVNININNTEYWKTVTVDKNGRLTPSGMFWTIPTLCKVIFLSGAHFIESEHIFKAALLFQFASPELLCLRHSSPGPGPQPRPAARPRPLLPFPGGSHQAEIRGKCRWVQCSVFLSQSVVERGIIFMVLKSFPNFTPPPACDSKDNDSLVWLWQANLKL